MLPNTSDYQAMRLALAQAEQAYQAGEVPVGAVILLNGEPIAVGFNQPIGLHDPTAHAEIIALHAAAQRLSNYRLPECELFVTPEPCAPWATFSAVALNAASASASIAQ